MQRFTHQFFHEFSRPDLANLRLEEAVESLEQTGWEIVQIFVDSGGERVRFSRDIPDKFSGWLVFAKKPAT